MSNESIERFGHTNPILIDDGGQIIAGHGRVEAAKLLGIESVPALRLSHLSAADKRAYVIADNRLAEKAGWDRELLAIELQALVDLEFDVELTGFEMGEIDIILSDSDEAKDETAGPEDDVPDSLPDRIVSRLGDIWILGKHRLHCGDARDQAAYDQLLTGDKAELVVTDPPYNVAIDGHVSGKGSICHPRVRHGQWRNDQRVVHRVPNRCVRLSGQQHDCGLHPLHIHGLAARR